MVEACGDTLGIQSVDIRLQRDLNDARQNLHVLTDLPRIWPYRLVIPISLYVWSLVLGPGTLLNLRSQGLLLVHRSYSTLESQSERASVMSLLLVVLLSRQPLHPYHLLSRSLPVSVALLLLEVLPLLIGYDDWICYGLSASVYLHFQFE